MRKLKLFLYFISSLLLLTGCSDIVGALFGEGGSSENPILFVSVSTLNFGVNSKSRAFTIKNEGDGTLNWSISDDRNWISVSPANGSTTTEEDELEVTVTRPGLNPGAHTGTISISSNGGDDSIEILLETNTPPIASFTVKPSSVIFPIPSKLNI